MNRVDLPAGFRVSRHPVYSRDDWGRIIFDRQPWMKESRPRLEWGYTVQKKRFGLLWIDCGLFEMRCFKTEEDAIIAAHKLATQSPSGEG